MPPFKAEFRRTLERDARQRLEELLPLAARAECNTSVILAEGKASREVLRAATAHEADLFDVVASAKEQ